MRLALGAIMGPPRLLAAGFAAAIGVGTLLLTLPAATADGLGLPVLDAFFTATSAVCVTGLTVVNIGADLSAFGQVVVLLLIQVGGLGVMTVTTLFAYAVRRRVPLRDSLTVGEAFGRFNLTAGGQLVRDVTLVTLAVEGTGAVLLALAFGRDYPLGQATYYGVFHSVSAFCNAGFDLFGRSLTGYVTNLPVNLVVMVLIITGGLGFLVITEVVSFLRNGWFRGYQASNGAGGAAAHRLSLHTRVVLATTALLILAGTVIILGLEFSNPATLGPLSLGHKVLAATFQAVTPRTAGFNTVATGRLLQPTLLVLVVLMFIGASPGSTGGGIKTTTFATVFAAVRSALRRRDDVELGGRRLPAEVAQKAWTITALALGLVTVVIFALLVTETAPLMDLLFEAVSAFGTVGLSTGITPNLSAPGRVLIPLLMYAGRVGPLTLAAALTRGRSPGPDWHLPEERIVVG